MLVWLIYDISSNKTRRHIVKLCQTRGLYRVQKSVFCGNIDRDTLDELVIRSKELIEPDNKTGNDSLYVFPLCEKDFKKVKIIGKGFDKKLVSDKLKSLVL